MSMPGGGNPATKEGSTSLFDSLSPGARTRLLAIATPQSFAAGTVLVNEGDAGDSFCVLTKGVVSVTVDDLGTAKDMARLGPGSFFGEISVITAQPRSATVTAVTAVEVLRFDKQEISEVLRDCPEVREVLAKMALRRLEDTLEKMAELSDEPMPDPNAGSSSSNIP